MSDLLDTRVDTREAIDELAVPKVKPVRKFAPVYAPNDTREAIDPNVSPYEVPLGAAPDVRLRAQKQLADVQALYKIADIQGALDPKTGEKERQKIGVSLFLSSQLNMDARDIYRSFAGDYSPIAADYFKSTDIPYSYWDRAKVVWESTIVQSQVNLLASKMYLSGWNEETNKEIVKLLKSSPYVPPRDKGLIGWAKDAPLELIRQGYSLFTMGGASAAGAAVGGSIGSAFGPGGTAVGTVAGRMIGTMISATAVEAADIYQQTLYSRVIDPETGEEKYAYELVNDPAAFAKIAAASAAIPALLIGAANTLGWEAILGKLPFPKFISNVLEKGALKGLYATSVGKFMATYGKNITTEMLTESFESIMEQKGVDAAVRKANKEFGSRIPESDINTYVNLIRQTMDSVAKLSIFLALPGSIGETARGLQADYVERGMTPEIQKKIDELARISTPAVVEPKANLYKTESGDLYSVQRETRTEADGSKRIMLKYGDPMVEGDNRYGHAVVIEKAGQVIIEEVVSEKDYNVEPQIIKQIAADRRRRSS